MPPCHPHTPHARRVGRPYDETQDEQDELGAQGERLSPPAHTSHACRVGDRCGDSGLRTSRASRGSRESVPRTHILRTTIRCGDSGLGTSRASMASVSPFKIPRTCFGQSPGPRRCECGSGTVVPSDCRQRRRCALERVPGKLKPAGGGDRL